MYIHLFEDNTRLADAQARSAVFGGNQNRQPAGLGQGFYEVFGVTALSVEIPPVFVGVSRAELAHCVSQVLMLISHSYCFLGL
jgi:hypothetical protein